MNNSQNQAHFEPNNTLTVSDLNQLSCQALEHAVGSAWVIGEVSNVAKPSSGHCYFSLKDPHAQVRCALFSRSKRNMTFELENGQQVLVHAKVSLYQPRGDYQLIINQLQLAGDGLLQIQFEQLKKKLFKEGLFAPQHKQSLPTFAKQIGVVTSKTGAAIRDILTVLKRRFPLTPVVIYPCLVQGKTAADAIVNAIATANQRQECDLLILARGGGSLEDLWCFNEESVAHSIFNSKLPIITGVGHEVDITIADYVADHRAATPSAAAEMASQSQQQWSDHLQQARQHLHRMLQHCLSNKQQQLQHLQQRLRHPGEKIKEHMQSLDQLELRLHSSIKQTVQLSTARLGTLSRTLHSLSPLNTLERGYTITFNQQHIIHSVSQLKQHDNLTLQFHDGKAAITVNHLELAIDQNTI